MLIGPVFCFFLFKKQRRYPQNNEWIKTLVAISHMKNLISIGYSAIKSKINDVLLTKKKKVRHKKRRIGITQRLSTALINTSLINTSLQQTPRNYITLS